MPGETTDKSRGATLAIAADAAAGYFERVRRAETMGDEARAAAAAEAMSAAFRSWAGPGGVDNPYDRQTIDQPYIAYERTAIIPVHGILIPRFPLSLPFITGYDFIGQALAEALADNDIDDILLDVDSPGGAAAGDFELCRDIIAARAVKPIAAFANATATSAAYAIAAAAETTYAMPSSAMGSIGVLYIHEDISGMLAMEGRKITLITAGSLKAEGNPLEPISAEFMQKKQRELDGMWEEFIALVTQARPNLTPDVIRSMEGAVISGAEAVDAGLADELMTPEQMRERIGGGSGGQDDEQERPIMPAARGNRQTAGDAQAATAGNEPAETRAADTAPAPVDTNSPQFKAVVEDTVKEQMAAFRQRTRQIESLEGAKTAPALTRAIIDNENLSVEQAKTLLAAAPADIAAAAAKAVKDADTENHLENAMKAEPDAEVPPGDEATKDDAKLAKQAATPRIVSNQMLKDYYLVKGVDVTGDKRFTKNKDGSRK